MAWVTFARYAMISTLAAAAVCWHAFSTRRLYYPSMYYMASSKLNVAVLSNFGFVLTLCVYKVILQVLMGRLRESETERITERIKHGIVEIFLSMSIFGGKIELMFIFLMVVLVFVKIFHWLIQDRIDFMQTEPNVSRFQHARTVACLSLLAVTDVLFVKSNITATASGTGAGHNILFTFEYVILSFMVLAAATKYAFALLDASLDHRWQSKGLYTLYLELFLDVVHFVCYTVFFLHVTHFYETVPFHLIYDVYGAYRSLFRRATNYLRYRSVMSKMSGLAEASTEDLERTGGVCIICREDMALAEGLKKLGCDHVFHLACLQSWLERQQSCPICRSPILPPAVQAGSRAAEAEAVPREQVGAGRDAQPAERAAGAGGHRFRGAAEESAPGVGVGQAQQQGSTQDTVGVGRSGSGAGAAQLPILLPDAAGQAAEPGTAAPPGNSDGQPLPGGVAREHPDVAFLTQYLNGGDAAATGQRQAGMPTQGDVPAPFPAQATFFSIGASQATAPALHMALPANATQEQRAAFAAASAAFLNMSPYFAPIYQPFGMPPAPYAPYTAPPVPTPISPQTTNDSAASTSSPAPGPAAAACASTAATPTEGLSVEARAAAAATAAVTASIAAARQLLRGQIAVLQQQMDSLDRVEEAAADEARRREPATSAGPSEST